MSKLKTGHGIAPLHVDTVSKFNFDGLKRGSKSRNWGFVALPYCGEVGVGVAPRRLTEQLLSSRGIDFARSEQVETKIQFPRGDDVKMTTGSSGRLVSGTGKFLVAINWVFETKSISDDYSRHCLLIISESHKQQKFLSPKPSHQLNRAAMSPSPKWKATNKSIQILKSAEEGKYGVLATVAYNVEHILGMIQAAEAARSPLIIQFFPWAITFSDGLLIRAAADAASRASAPVAIHLDHAQDEKLIRLAADTLPFDSIMVDMSHYEKDENLRKTAELVKYCHDRGIATEAEPGRIEGGEDGVMDTHGLEGSMTTMNEVTEFVGTGVDALAPAIGNMHGENPYAKSDPNLDFDR